MADTVTPLVFVGGSRATPIEAVLADAHEAIARDLLDRLLALPAFDRPIVATPSPGFAAAIRDLPVHVVLDDGKFHFGRILAGLIDRFTIRRAFYLGGGSAPLLSGSGLSLVAALLLAQERAVVANNFFSADFVAFSPASAIHQINLPEIDNDLAYRLQREAGLENVPLARSAGTQMDVDTPTDLLVLAVHPGVGSHTRRFLERADLDLSRVRAMSQFLTDPSAEVIVSGRVGSSVLAHLESDLACRTRVFSEERGMRASGREARGEVRSLLGFHLQAVGPRRFFANLAELGNAAFIDSRVLFHHLGIQPTPADRFYSDLLWANRIDDPTVRAFTEAAVDAPLPVLLGGHSLVAGGLWALTDAAWLERDQRLGQRQPG